MSFFTTRFSSPSARLQEAYWLHWCGYKEDASHILHEICRDIDRPKKKERWSGIEKIEAYETPEGEVAAGSSDDEYSAWWERANDWR